MKLKELTPEMAYHPATRAGFLGRQFTRGLPLSFFGVFVYAALRLIGKRPVRYRGICDCFEIGEKWGGFALGFFFVTEKGGSERLRAHEYGHCIANASVGGFRMLACSVASAVRYRRHIFREKHGKPVEPYEQWWFERQASELGR